MDISMKVVRKIQNMLGTLPLKVASKKPHGKDVVFENVSSLVTLSL